jgi:lipopolysaccharide/colanic/teichoic acid biosynthesis glycosyltransferase
MSRVWSGATETNDEQMLKRFFDILFSAIGIILLAPLVAILALAIKKSSSGPVLYRGMRVGRGGKLFRMLKFRTMVVNAEALGGSCTSDDDPRITSIGRRLRKYKLDELPQLLNVLRGEMSFVGPRPEVKQYVAMYSEEEKQILSLRPGVTDLATLWDSDEGALLAGSSDPERIYLETIRPEKMRLQLEYVRKRTLLLDFRIVCSTVALVFRRLKTAL